jgi:hypothetical protein
VTLVPTGVGNREARDAMVLAEALERWAHLLTPKARAAQQRVLRRYGERYWYVVSRKKVPG